MMRVRPPEGYLGTAARITSGPAPELVEAGYALEIGDAPLLHRGLTLADLAHLVELVECGALTRDEAAPVGAVLLKLLDSPAAEFPYDPVYGDAYNSRERELEQELGPAAGRLHLGRTRREAGRIAFRLALRDRLLSLHTDVAAFARAVADQATSQAGHCGRTPPISSPRNRPRSGIIWAASPSRPCGTWTGSRPPTASWTSRPAVRAGWAAPGCRWTGAGWPRDWASARSARTPATRCGRPMCWPTRSWRRRRR